MPIFNSEKYPVSQYATQIPTNKLNGGVQTRHFLSLIHLAQSRGHSAHI